MAISPYQRQLRQRYLDAPVVAAPGPWRPVLDNGTPIGGLLGIGFGVHPGNGHELVMVVSGDGHGLFDAVTGERIARDRDPDPATSTPDGRPDLSCPGLGPLAGTSVPIAGLFGGGPHTSTPDGWSVDVVSPEWPHHRVILSTGTTWWHVFHADYSELRTAGFSPSGHTFAVATSSDLTLWTRPQAPAEGTGSCPAGVTG